jgi:hypothetical protein
MRREIGSRDELGRRTLKLDKSLTHETSLWRGPHE